jgi:hypothetical protein
MEIDIIEKKQNIIIENDKKKSKELINEYLKLKEICEEVLLMVKSLSLDDMGLNPTVKTPTLTDEQEKQLNDNFNKYVDKTPEELGYLFSIKCKSVWFPN